MRVVVDASVAIPCVHPEDTSTQVRRWIARGTTAGSLYLVPAHFWLEIVNALARRHRYSGDAVLEAVVELGQLGFETVDLDEAALVLVIDAVERHGLSAYDAQYLALSRQLDIPLATLDPRLASAASMKPGPGAIDPLAPLGISEPRARYGEPRQPTWPNYAGAASYLASIRGRAAQAGRSAGLSPRPAVSR